jgi:hypothetical protein
MSDKKKSAPKPADVKAPGPEKKSQEELNIAGLLEIVQAQADTIARHEAAQEDFKDLVNDLRGRVEAQEEAGEPVERESDVFIDPFEDHDALVFKCDIIKPDSNFEFGRKLKWINPKLRNEIGMRGWEPVKLGDSFLMAEVKNLETGKVTEEAGAGLINYLNAIPSRMEGSSRLDDYIRRGDVLLCWIDMKIYIARMRRRDEDALNKRLMLSDEGDQYDVKGRKGAHIIGPGLTRGGDPRLNRSARSQYMPDNLDPHSGNLSKSSAYIPVKATPPPRK